MHLLFVSGEVAPFTPPSREGERVRSLACAAALHNRADTVSVLLPLYFCVPENVRRRMRLLEEFTFRYGWRDADGALYRLREDGVNYYFLRCDRYFDRERTAGYFDDGERFAYFAYAVLSRLGKSVPAPQLLVCSGYAAAFTLMAHRYRADLALPSMRTVLLPGALSEQGVFSQATLGEIFALPPSARECLLYGCVNLLWGGMRCADRILLPTPGERAALFDEAASFGLAGALCRIPLPVDVLPDGGEPEDLQAALSLPYTRTSAPEGKRRNKEAYLAACGFLPTSLYPLVAVTGELCARSAPLLLRYAPCLTDASVRLFFCGVGQESCLRALRGMAQREPGRIRVVLSDDVAEQARLLAAADLAVDFSGTAEGIARPLSLFTPVLARSSPRVPEETEGCFFYHGEEDFLPVFRQAVELYRHRGSWRKVIRQIRYTRASWEDAAAALRSVAFREEGKVCG